MPRILVLSKYTKLGASSRLRIHQYQFHLERAGYQIEYMPLFDDEYLESLYDSYKRRQNRYKYIYRRIIELIRTSPPDVIWVEYEIFPWIPWCLEKLLIPKNIPIICDYDDAIFHQYDLHKNPIIRILLEKKIDKIMRYSALTIAGNEYIQKRALRAGAQNTTIIPTVVDTRRYKQKSPESFAKTINVGWIGTPVTWSAYGKEMYLNLREILKETGATFRAIGAKQINEKHESLIIKPWTEELETGEIRRFNVGIMPLTDTPWSQGKCGYKLIQYMASGVPVIASPVGVNSKLVEDGENGYCANNMEEWHQYLYKILKYPELAFKMGQAGRAKVEKEYSLEVWAPILCQLIDSVIKNYRKL